MAYEKTNWQTGDTVTAEKLNHAENGISDNSVQVYVGTLLEGGDLQFDLTYNQVVAALQAGKDLRLYTGGTLEGTEIPTCALDIVLATTVTPAGGGTSTYFYSVHTAGQYTYWSTDPDAPITSIDPT